MHDFHSIFKIQFLQTLLGSYLTALAGAEKNSWYISRLGETYRARQAYGFSVIEEFKSFKPWKPKQWNGFCFLCRQNHYNLSLNNLNVLSWSMKESSDLFQNMLGLQLGPMFGAVTDLHIWQRLLTEQEIHDFNNCQLRPGGDVYQWRPSGLTIASGMMIEDVPRNEFCRQSRKHILIWKGKLLDFNETIDYCSQVLNGRMAVAKNTETLRAMERLNKISECPNVFYSGHIHLGNRKYVDFYDKKPMNLRKVEIKFYKKKILKQLRGKKKTRFPFQLECRPTE